MLLMGRCLQVKKRERGRRKYKSMTVDNEKIISTFAKNIYYFPGNTICILPFQRIFKLPKKES